MPEGGATDKPGGRAPPVFVSYASQDAAIADAVVAALERAGLACWIAPRNAVPGSLYADEIVGAINDAKSVVLVLSAHAIASPHVGKEIERAAAKRRPIVALRVDSAPLTRAFEYFLSESQWIEVGSDGVKAAGIRLVEALRHHIDACEAPEPPNFSDHAVARRALGKALTKWAVAGGVVVIGLAFAYLTVDKFWLAHNRVNGRRAAAAVPSLSRSAPTSSEKSIVVLPFADLSEKHDQEYFADGLSEELIDRLTHSPGLRVIARTSSFYFKGRPSTIADIASALHVTHVLEGSVRKSGNALKITAQLIRVTDGTHLWSQTYDRTLSDIFKVQGEIAVTVSAALNAAIRGLPVAVSATSNVGAYNLLLEGYFYYKRGNSGDNARAIDSYDRALKLDPGYASAWARLAAAYLAQGLSASPEVDAAEAERNARTALDRALAIDPKLPMAHQLLGRLEAYVRWDWLAAQAEFERALTLAADEKEQLPIKIDLEYARARRQDSYSEELLRLMQQKLDGDPLDVDAMLALAGAYDSNGRLEDARALVARLLAINPTYVPGNAFMAVVLLHMSRLDEAFAAAQKETDENTRLSTLVQVTWTMGRREESDRYLADFTKKFSRLDPYSLAWMHAWRGEKDQAFWWLDRAYRARAPGMTELRLETPLRSLRGDPRFTALLRKMDLLE